MTPLVTRFCYSRRRWRRHRAREPSSPNPLDTPRACRTAGGGPTDARPPQKGTRATSPRTRATSGQTAAAGRRDQWPTRTGTPSPPDGSTASGSGAAPRQGCQAVTEVCNSALPKSVFRSRACSPPGHRPSQPSAGSAWPRPAYAGGAAPRAATREAGHPGRLRRHPGTRAVTQTWTMEQEVSYTLFWDTSRAASETSQKIDRRGQPTSTTTGRTASGSTTACRLGRH